MIRHLTFGLVAFALASAQQPAAKPSFEVASVKLASGSSALPPMIPPQGEMRIRFQGGPGTRQPERIDYRGVTLRMLIQHAYDVESFQVAGPPWMDQQRYSITAKVPSGATATECKLMLQKLLTERFLLREHFESKPFRVYDLILSKGGPKFSTQTVVLPEGQDRAAVASSLMQEQRKAVQRLGVVGAKTLFLTYESMPEFAARLSQYLDRPAVDKTQLSGSFSLCLVWGADGDTGGGGPDGPPLFVALREELGLELRPARENLRVIVVDSAERSPTEN